MALAKENFTDGSTAVVAQIYELSANITGDVTSDTYEFFCNTELEENFNEEIITKYTLCGEGTASNSLGGQDYEIPFEIEQTKGATELSQWAYKIKHDQIKRVNIPIRLDNTLLDVRTEFIGVILLDSAGGAAEEKALLSGTIKPYKGKITTGPIPS